MRGEVVPVLVISLLVVAVAALASVGLAAITPIHDRMICDGPHPFDVSPLSTVRQDIETRCRWEKSNPPRTILGYYMDRWR